MKLTDLFEYGKTVNNEGEIKIFLRQKKSWGSSLDLPYKKCYREFFKLKQIHLKSNTNAYELILTSMLIHNWQDVSKNTHQKYHTQ